MALESPPADSTTTDIAPLRLLYSQVPLYTVPDARTAPIRQVTPDDVAGLELVSPESVLDHSDQFHQVRLADGSEGYVYAGNVVLSSVDAARTDDERRRAANVLPTVKVWSPLALQVVTVLCGFVAGSILWFISRRRLGLIASLPRDSGLLVGACVLITAFWAFLPNGAPAYVLALMINLGGMWFFNSTLQKDIRSYEARGGEVEHEGKLSALGIGILGIVIATVLNQGALQIIAEIVAR